MAKLEISVLVGAESKQWLADLTKVIDKLESLSEKTGATASVKTEVKTAAPADDDDDSSDFAPAATKKSNAASKAFEDDGDDEPVKAAPAKKAAKPLDDEDDNDAADFMTPPKKTVKVKKITIDQCNDACMAKAASIGGKEGRKTVLAILKKEFKTESVSEIEPDQFERLLKVMAV